MQNKIPVGNVPIWQKDNREWRRVGYAPSDICIFWNHMWMKKVEFCCEILGSARVTDLYKEWARDNQVTEQPAQLHKSVNPSFPTDSYNEFFAMIFDMACHDAGVSNTGLSQGL